MKGYNKWSYAPYRPLLTDVGDIYICRIAPDTDKIHFEWLGGSDGVYSVFCKERGEEDFIFLGNTENTFFDIEGLRENTEYEFFVSSENKKSRVRLARCGKSVGTVVNYLHPDDTAYSFSGRYLCSPSMVRHPGGYLLASMDLYAHNHPQNLTLIFRSDDDGKTWSYVSELMPCFWGKMFIHKGDLYMIACSTEYGDLLIGKSTDGGKTFSAPVSIYRGSNGKNGSTGMHKNPQNVVIHNGRIYNSIEWGSWSNKEFYHAVMVISCSVDDDLLDPESWHLSEPVVYNPEWEGVAKGATKGNLEGTLVVAPDGNLYNVMRYNIDDAVPKYGLVLAYKVNTEDPDAPVEYSHAIQMSCNNSKFMIKHDPVSNRYYSVATRIDCEERIRARNLLSLMISDDMKTWRVAADIFDRRDTDMKKVGFQYVDFEFEGDDIIFLCRTAINEAHSYHDSNYTTFHRIKNFRDI